MVSDASDNVSNHQGRHLLAAQLPNQDASKHVSYIKLEGADSIGNVSSLWQRERGREGGKEE